jgi:O-acetyl-ADP-ribose deacetylase (regulator of RNase III)
MLTLAQYRSQLHLDEPFIPSGHIGSLPAADEVAPARLLARLREHDRRVPRMPAGLSPRQALYAALISRPALPFPEGFLEDLDALLGTEAAARPITEAAALPRCSEESGRADLFHRTCALWQGDITTLRVDAIVNAANSQLLGCFQPFHACIDNCIHAAAGPRLRADCQAIMDRQGRLEPTGSAKLTRAYHLPAHYVLHTVGPIISGQTEAVPATQCDELASCYRSCLELATAIPRIRSLAFCCISTGVFGFPAEPAARIAVRTVAQWLTEHPGRLDLIVFNVFTPKDLSIYRNVLTRSQP